MCLPRQRFTLIVHALSLLCSGACLASSDVHAADPNTEHETSSSASSNGTPKIAQDQGPDNSSRGDGLETPELSEISVLLTEIASGLSGPVESIPQFLATDLAPFADGSGRLAVMTLGGVIRIIDPVHGLLEEPYLIVVNEDTHIDPAYFGMVSLVFHPDFANPDAPGHGKFYTIETELEGSAIADFDGSLLPSSFSGRHDDVLYEYTASDTNADQFAGTKREVFRVLQPGRTHNVFDLAFGIADDSNSLYISVGDGDNAGQSVSIIRQNAQFLGNVFGKVLRINPLGTNSENGNYGVPADNPFVETPDARPEIYSIGHRSPYRLNTDRVTGDLWLGEVGQSKIEEVNKIFAGANYGWPLKEGSFLFDETNHQSIAPDPDLDSNGNGDFADLNGLTDPQFELQHPTSLSLTGGTVYRGQDIPALQGLYMFADAFLPGLYIGNPMTGPVANEIGDIEQLRVSADGASLPIGVLGICEGADGEFYLLTYDGRILRIDRSGCSDADITGDNTLDIFDLFAFLDLFNADDPAADLTGDGVLDIFDVFAFLDLFNAGCA